MINWSWLIARLVSAIGSWIDASNLRNRVYKMAEEAEIMMTALEDIERMSREENIKKYAQKAIETVKNLPQDQLDQ
jgi:predicted KAP-like P-loop ATPase